MKRLLKYTLAALAAIFVLPTAFLCGLYQIGRASCRERV